ncbi:MAG: DHH family phosphoesterase [Lachnospiraceae bacterium]
MTVDIAGEGLFPEGTPAPVNLALDHHPSNSPLCGAHLPRGVRSPPAASWCSELIKPLGTGFLRGEARLLYIAVSTDTGCFQYSNTNAATLRRALRSSSSSAPTTPS